MCADILRPRMDSLAGYFEFLVVCYVALEVDFGITPRAEAVCSGGEGLLGKVVRGVDEDAVSGAARLAEGLVGEGVDVAGGEDGEDADGFGARGEGERDEWVAGGFDLVGVRGEEAGCGESGGG